MALTLLQLKTLVQDLLGDTGAQTYDVTDHLIPAINFAVKQYCHKTGVSYLEASAAVDAAGLATLPTDYMKINRVLYAGSQLIESGFEWEASKNPAWQTATGTAPKRWALWSGAKIKLTPIVATWPGTCTIGYTQNPTELALDADTVDARIPIQHNEYLKYAAAAWLLNLDNDIENVNMATNYMNMFNQLIGYSDPVLTVKLNQTRKEGKLEV